MMLEHQTAGVADWLLIFDRPSLLLLP
jgi:hypothetical protein